MTPTPIQQHLVEVSEILRKAGLHSLIDWLDTPDEFKPRLQTYFKTLVLGGNTIPSDLDWIYSCYSTPDCVVSFSRNRSKPF